jgi:hypothetical protein
VKIEVIAANVLEKLKSLKSPDVIAVVLFQFLEFVIEEDIHCLSQHSILCSISIVPVMQ